MIRPKPTYLFDVLLWMLSIALLTGACKQEDTNMPAPGPPDPEAPEFSIPDINDIIMYEVNIRAFGPGSDFKAVQERLGQIKKLNVNVIWLMPVHPIGTINSVNSPYSVQNYKGVNPEFGTLDALKLLIEEAHKQDIAVILDWVANHTAWDNPWIEQKDWYTQDGSGNIIHPPGTNWLDVADLNFDNQEMREAMIDAMKYWIAETDIDGFRCDAADMVPFSFWQQAIQELTANPDKPLILLAEGARKDHYTAGFQIAFSWDFYSRLKQVFNGEQQPKMLYITHQSEYSGVPETGKRLRFTTNHDESAWDATPVVLFHGIEGAIAASVVNTYMGGVPLIYGSQEVGAQGNVPFFEQTSINWSQNPGMLHTYQAIMEHYHNSDPAHSVDMTYYEHGKIIAFRKKVNEKELLVMVNSSNGLVSYTLPDELQNSSWVNGLDGESLEVGSHLDIEGYGYFILDR